MNNSVNSGWVKLYRELKSKSIWQLSSPSQKVVLITILLLANHEESKWEWGGKQYICKPGQLITSLNSLANECGKDVSIRNVRTALERFEMLGFLTNESTKTGRLITVINWGKYQGCKSEDGKDSDKEPTKSRQRGDKEVTKELTSNKKDKEIKNDKKDKEIKDKRSIVYFPEDELLDKAFNDYLEMRRQIKKPATERAIQLAISKLQDLSRLPFSDSMDNDRAIEILNQSVLNNWAGLYPLKGNAQDKGKGGIDWSKV